MKMETIIYTVKKGDTLYDIAKRCGTTVGMITRYNGIIEPDMIYPGQILRIPVSEIPCMKKNCAPEIEYIVKKGDTLADIAIRFGSGIRAISQLNGITDPDNIEAGRIIKIPVSKEGSYTIQKGDTLSEIARKTDATVAQIAENNEISDPDRITAGELIDIPEKEMAEDSQIGEDDSESIVEYLVKSGDTLWKIAKEYGVSVAYIINLNRLTRPDCLMEGQILRIR